MSETTLKINNARFTTARTFAALNAKKRRALFLCVVCAAVLPFSLCAQQNAQTRYPLTLTDGTGRTVTVAKCPKRIVSLGASVTEILFAVGAENLQCARTDFCNYPAEALQKPSIGGFDGKTISIEKIIAYKCDFVYGFATMHDYLVPLLEKYRIPVYLSDAKTIDGVMREISDIARVTNCTARGEAVIAEMKKDLDSVRAQQSEFGSAPSASNTARSSSVVRTTAAPSANETKARVYWEVWNAPYMSAGNASFINDIIEKANGVNIFSDVASSYPVVSEESIIARNPTVILLPNSNGVTANQVKKRNGWKTVDAVKNDAVFVIDSDLFSRASPRCTKAVLRLNELLQNAAAE